MQEQQTVKRQTFITNAVPCSSTAAEAGPFCQNHRNMRPAPMLMQNEVPELTNLTMVCSTMQNRKLICKLFASSSTEMWTYPLSSSTAICDTYESVSDLLNKLPIFSYICLCSTTLRQEHHSMYMTACDEPTSLDLHRWEERYTAYKEQKKMELSQRGPCSCSSSKSFCDAEQFSKYDWYSNPKTGINCIHPLRIYPCHRKQTHGESCHIRKQWVSNWRQNYTNR